MATLTFTSTHPTYGPFTASYTKGDKKCTVLFTNTGYSYEVFRSEVFNRAIPRVRDPLVPTKSGVGYIGVGPHKSTNGKGKDTPEYIAWSRMLERCYTFREQYKTYSDCSVCEEWKCFQTFSEDIKSLPGYSEWKKSKEDRSLPQWELDKDSLVEGNRVYSKDTCCFITSGKNVKEAVNRTRPVTKWAVGTIHPTKHGNVEMLVAPVKGKCTILFLDHNVTKETWTSSIRKDEVSPF